VLPHRASEAGSLTGHLAWIQRQIKRSLIQPTSQVAPNPNPPLPEPAFNPKKNLKPAALIRPPIRASDAHGRAPLLRPVITFLPSRHRSKADRFINRRGIIGLVGFAVPTSPIQAPLDLTDFGLASWPKSRLVKTSKTQKPQKLLKSLWDQEKSCWEGPV
jgi:hypothetical protein